MTGAPIISECSGCAGSGVTDSGKKCTRCGGSGDLYNGRAFDYDAHPPSQELLERRRKAEAEAKANPLKPLEGKRVVFRQDPFFGGAGWCLLTGNTITEMQTMQWVNPLLKRHKADVNATGTIQEGRLIIDNDPQGELF